MTILCFFGRLFAMFYAYRNFMIDIILWVFCVKVNCYCVFSLICLTVMIIMYVWLEHGVLSIDVLSYMD